MTNMIKNHRIRNPSLEITSRGLGGVGLTRRDHQNSRLGQDGIMRKIPMEIKRWRSTKMVRARVGIRMVRAAVNTEAASLLNMPIESGNESVIEITTENESETRRLEKRIETRTEIEKTNIGTANETTANDPGKIATVKTTMAITTMIMTNPRKRFKNQQKNSTRDTAPAATSEATTATPPEHNNNNDSMPNSSHLPNGHSQKTPSHHSSANTTPAPNPAPHSKEGEEKDIHKLERERNARERMLKEQQRRAKQGGAPSGNGGASQGTSLGRRMSHKYEDDLERHLVEGERQRHGGGRWR